MVMVGLRTRYPDAKISMNLHAITNMDLIESHAPYIIRRKIKDGAVVRGVPMVVKCEWTPVRTENLLVFDAALEDVLSNKPCKEHPYCFGPLYRSVSTGAYLILNGFARRDEIMSSDSNLINQACVNGDKNGSDIAKHCYSKIATKKGILRKQNNGCRPLNSIRLVASPLPSIEFGDLDQYGVVPRGWVEIPRRVMNRARFAYVAEDGKCRMRKMEHGETIVIGRCPSQGPDSTVPVRIRAAPPGVNTIRTPLELCHLTNLDFDGDEIWGWMHMTMPGRKELDERWHAFWVRSPPKPVFEAVYKVAIENGISPTIDPAVLTTMTFREMSTHRGGEMYESMLLKPKTWRQMYSVMVSPTYWKSSVTRGKAGIMNSVVSRHGLAGPYGFMRTGMMLGTCVTAIQNKIRIESVRSVDIPPALMPHDMIPLACSTALTKLTKIMYQKGIDTSKHGTNVSKVAAIDTLMGTDPGSYAVYAVSGGTTVVYHPGDGVMDTSVHEMADLYTDMSSLMNTDSPQSLIQKACFITSMVEEIDGVSLTDAERIMVSYFFAFVSRFLDRRPVVNGGTVPIELVIDLGLDWYTSVTCSDVRWFKDVMRNPSMRPRLNMSTDITSVLGSIFIGNMSMTAPGTTVRRGTRTVTPSMVSYGTL